MIYKQLIPFDTSKGGHVLDMCLDNVRRGYGIGTKYPTAWEAWLHTQQHTDRNIPAGLAVPLYYSYTATIDGVTQNYGHINVQLPDGTVWSDGNIYASIDAYTANHYPKFVGWGESVNDFKILQEGEDVIPDDDNNYGRYSKTFLMIRGRLPTRQEFQTSAVGKTWLQALEILEDDPEADTCQHWQEVGKVAVTDNWEGQINGLEQALAAKGTKLNPGTYIV